MTGIPKSDGSRARSGEDVAARREAVRALAERGEEAFEPLALALHDEDVDVQLTAVRALGDLNDPRAASLLADTLSKTALDDFVRREALLGLAVRRDADRVIAALVDEAQGPIVRAEAALALAELRDPRSIEPLLAVLQNAHERVRAAAAVALEKVGDAEAARALRLAAINDEARAVRRAAARAAKAHQEID